NKKTQQEPGASATFYVAATAPTASPQAANAAACTEDDSDGDESDGEVSNSSPASSPQGGRRSISGPMASAEGDIAGGASGSESSDLQASPPMPPNRRSSIDKSVSVGGPTVAASAATAVGAMGKKRKKLKVSTSLSDMVSICRPVKFKGQKYARENYRPVEMSSLTESKVEKKQWLKKDGEDANRMVLHTQYQLVRVYPSGLRTNSSNYNPINAWRLGCQLGFNPHWLYRCFEDNEVVRVPELAHLRLEVKDKSSGKVIGQFTAPLTAFNKVRTCSENSTTNQ
uniref:PI-PLC Y-box domain-containing protein n=1 Tax=Macrostomum lignano TaxID=282301 RepID=A0A1I8IMI3_9PLAT